MAKQHLSFSELYHNCKERAENTLATLWCGEAGNESQKSYTRQIRGLISRLFAPETAVPLVECLNRYRSVYSVAESEAVNLVDGLWDKPFAPYEHQYQCWNTVLNERTETGEYKSFVVTTGTGSGKTECFMLPLVADLKRNPSPNKTQAIFLYPLNALMEDQKSRLEALLEGTEIRYCVYNGDLPEKEPDPKDSSDFAKSERRKIRMIKGEYRDEETGEIKYKYAHCIATRKELRHHPAEILLTNPTMLEYILLRKKDEHLLSPKSLRWMVIDETHTYSGAGAAEMAMLLRRVLLAFNLSAPEIRFAISSATLGNPKTEEERRRMVEDLRKFIADLTGLRIEQVEVIGGQRRGTETIPAGKDYATWEKIVNAPYGYISLSELFPKEKTIEEKLRNLDAMCSRLPGNTELKVKVHFFFRVPNNGLFVRLSEVIGGSFKIYPEKPTDKSSQDAPLLELSRCKHCGEYVAVAQISGDTYGPIMMDDSDMFEIEPGEDERSDKFIFALTDRQLQPGDNNVGFNIVGDRFLESPGMMNSDGDWRVIANTQNRCPHCGTKLTKTVGDDYSEDSYQEEDGKKLQKFRLSTDLISRIIAPEILDQLAKADNPEGLLHNGQQYISFVDSRQGAAKGSMGQNLEQERMWAYSKIFHELNRRKREASNLEKDIEAHEKELPKLNPRTDRARIAQIYNKIDELESRKNASLSWSEITEILSSDPISDKFARQFAKRTADSKELDPDGNVDPLTKRRYIQSIMVEFLGKRPLQSASPENMGLFTTTYPQLLPVLSGELPEAVERFNERLENESLRITQNDWHDFLQIFMDYTVRSNESIFLRLSETDPIDIRATNRFSTQRQRRRTVRKPMVESGNPARSVRYLAQLLVDDGAFASQKDALRFMADEIQDVIDAMWTDLTETYKLLEHGTQFKDGVHVKDKNMTSGDDPVPWRLNVANLSFRLFSDVALCDTNTNGSQLSARRYRPVDVRFKNYSPYLKNRTNIIRIEDNMKETWDVYPDFETEEEMIAWAAEHRKLLWENGLWGDGGIFAERLKSIYGHPDIFIQAEHTAQVDKIISRQVQDEFKKHMLNVLACSTTMEMGVDLGDLELVMMSSVPPQPSNYKQRAGRSGRNEYIKSVAITLCGSDAIGLRTQLKPKENMITRQMATPETDLNSAQVVQRHVNAFLVREFGVFGIGEHAGSINQKVADYYTTFVRGKEGSHVRFYKADNSPASPNDLLGETTGTPYELFNERCAQGPSDELRNKLAILLRGTIYEGREAYVVAKAREINERCYEELAWKMEDLSISFKGATSQNYRNLLTYKYVELLDEQLLGFWATNRFTPNANMPVNVVSFDVNSGLESYYKVSTSSNPSYSLRDALQQYAPGNSITIDGRVNIVRGLRYTGFFKQNVTFKTLYHNREQTVIDAKNDISGLITWPVNNQLGLEMIQPSEFLPDVNETENRIMSSNVFTRVNAQLVGTSEWRDIVTEPHLFSMRNNRECGSAKILYYNDGIGYGYSHCTCCGKTVLETAVADPRRKLDKLPGEFNDRTNEEETTEYHCKISGKTANDFCPGSTHPESVRRNVILGDLIQTDYTEIRIRLKNEKKWINRADIQMNLLITLGLVFSRSLAEILGKDTSAIGFAITPNGHICVFDTNPGGAGYSNQLVEMDMMKAVIKHSYEILKTAEAAKSKDMILDKFSMQFIEKVDIPAAISWIEQEMENSASIPDEVSSVVGAKAEESSLTQIQRAIAQAEGEIVLFVDNDYAKWNYGDSDSGWRGHLLNHFYRKGGNMRFMIVENASAFMNEPIKNMARELNSWVRSVERISNPFVGSEIYPLAYLNGKLYLTNNSEFATLNERWGNGTVFVAPVELNISEAEKVDLKYRQTTAIVKIEGDHHREISSKSLGEIIESKARHIIEEFAAHCRRNDSDLKVVYQDEHLKSILGIALTLQTIEHFVRKFEKPFSLEYKVEKYQDIVRRRDIQTNMQNNADRDFALDGMTEIWADGLDIRCSYERVVPQERNTLTHWRVLSVECAGKKLCIYPDGGLMNGWRLSRNNTVSYTPENCDASCDILLNRVQDIKVDVTIENC